MNTRRPIREPDILIQDLGTETLLYNAELGTIHILNPTAKRIWELCDGKHTPVAIAQAIRSSFDVPDVHDLIGDVRRTLDIFAQKRILHKENCL